MTATIVHENKKCNAAATTSNNDCCAHMMRNKAALQTAAEDYNDPSLTKNYDDLDFGQTSSTGDATSFELHSKTLAALDVRGKVVLEIGCAGGEHLRTFLGRGAKELIGVDQNELFLQIARTETDAAKTDTDSPSRFIAADMHALPLLDQSVDIIVSRHTMHYSEDVAQLVQELSRVLRPEGKLISVFNVVEMRSASKYLEAPVSTDRWYPLFIDFGDRQFQARNCATSSQDWFDALADCGFQVTLSQQLDANEKWDNSKVQYEHHEVANLFAQTIHADFLPAFDAP